MILDIEIFKDTPDAPKDATFVPVVFPLIAGAGALTTLLSIRAQYNDINILLAVICNMVIVYLVLKLTKRIERMLGAGFIYMLQKFSVSFCWRFQSNCLPPTSPFWLNTSNNCRNYNFINPCSRKL